MTILLNRKIVAIVFSFASLLSGTRLGAAQPNPGLSVKVSISPAKVDSFGADPEDRWFECSSVITDLQSGEKLPSPHGQFKMGAEFVANLVIDPSQGKPEKKFAFKAGLEDSGAHAFYSVTYMVDGKVISIQEGSLRVGPLPTR
jgi:hypothetical protein